MKRTIFIIPGIFLLVLGLALITNLRFKRMVSNFNQSSFSFPSLPKFEKIELIPPQVSPQTNGTTTYREFVTPDEKFKITYPGDWLVVEEREILDGLVADGLSEKFGLEILFLAQGLQKDELGQIMLSRGIFNMPIKEIVGEMEKNNQERSWQTEIIKEELGENEGIFEIKYRTSANKLLHSKEKIWTSNEGKSYLFVFIAPEENWQKLLPTIDKIEIIGYNTP